LGREEKEKMASNHSFVEAVNALTVEELRRYVLQSQEREKLATVENAGVPITDEHQSPNITWKRTYPLVEVLWVDCGYVFGWQDIDDYLKETPSFPWCKTAGYLAANDDEKLVVMLTISDNADFCGAMQIPKRQVISIRDLRD
jgi:hypothetical protein